jgi:putative peptidoglycan lipid II flippase
MSRRIGIASTIWGASIFLSRVVGMVREAVIGRTLGGSAQADVYWTAFVVPDFLNYLLAGGALSIVFIPIFSAYLARQEEERGWEAFSSIATFLLVLMGALTAVLFILLPHITALVAPGFGAAEQAELVALTRIILPAQVFHVVGGLLSAALQARDRHLVPALAPLVYTGCIVAGGLIGGSAAGAYGFAWGVLAGSVLGPFGLPLAACLKSGLRWRWRFDLANADLRHYLARSLPIMLGWSIVVVDDWYLRREGSLLPEGSVATLTYAKNLMKVPMGVFGLAAGVAAYPALTRMVVERRTGDMYRTLIATSRNVLLLAFAAQVVLTVCGEDIAALVYGRGRIPPEQLHEIGVCLALVSIGLSAWSAQTLIARGFYALGNTWLPALLGTAVAIAAYPVYVLARHALGTYGLACASSGAVIVYVVLLSVLLERRITREEGPAAHGSMLFLARCGIALGVAIAAGLATSSVLAQPDGFVWLAARVLLLSASSVLVFGAVARLLGLPEVGALCRAIGRALGISSRRPIGLEREAVVGENPEG